MIYWEKPSGSVVQTNETPASIKKAESLGWTRTEAPIKVDKNMGRPGSKEWNINTIAMMEDKNEISDYVRRFVDVKLDLRQNMKDVKLAAIKALKGTE